MQPKKKALAVAAVGTALGVGGLVFVAMPASAGDAPVLPQVSAQDLVQSVVTAKPGAFDGTVQVTNNLGLPKLGNAVPGGEVLSMDNAHVFSDGAGKSRVSITTGASQETIVHDGTTVWDYSSKSNSVTKTTIPADVAKQHPGPAGDKTADPATAATQLLAKAQQTSNIAVDGTATVGNRPAYELVLTPKPSERTLLREIRVAIDSQTRMPLQLSVFGNGETTPVLQFGFTGIEFTSQPANLFTFTPPKDAKVTQKQPKIDAQTRDEANQFQQDTKVVGDGWDTVVTGKVPADLLNGQQPAAQPGQKHGQMDPKALLARFAKRVQGAWGSGYLVTTKVGTAVLTDDGRFAAGAVPEQVLYEALGAK